MALLQHSLIYGLILSALLMGVILAAALLKPAVPARVALADVPAGAGPSKADMRRERKRLAVPVLLAVVATLTAAVWTLPMAGIGPGFGTVFALGFLVAFVFNLFDLLVIDWLLIVAWHPRWFVPPGTEGDAANRTYRFHFKGFLKGLGFCVVAGLITAGLNGLITGRW
jgi:hypothetical protein